MEKRAISVPRDPRDPRDPRENQVLLVNQECTRRLMVLLPMKPEMLS